MANHVHYFIEFHQMNDAAKEKFEELKKRIRLGEGQSWFGDLFVDGEELTYEETEQYSWTTENIGPKWCYIEDMSETHLSGEAAWSAPEVGLEKLLDILEEFDPKMITSIRYEDEAPNFVGCSVYEGSSMEDGFEYEWDELREAVVSQSNVLTEESWNEEEEDWVDDESRDAFEEELWESISESQDDCIYDAVKWILESQEETTNE